MKKIYAALTKREDVRQWLMNALESDARLVLADLDDPEQVLHLVDADGIRLLFVPFAFPHAAAQARLVARLVAARPNLRIIAVADEADNDLILTAIRAGAHDFLRIGSNPAEVQTCVARLRDKPHGRPGAASGRLMTVLCARPGEESATLAVHLALAMRELTDPEHPLLLMDLGVPPADTLLFLDMKPTYTFADALRSVRRFDDTLIKSAFAMHSSGLTVLPMAEDALERPTGTSLHDALVLVDVLTGYFEVVVANLGGMPQSDFLAQVVLRSERILLLAEQSVASVNASRRLIRFLLENGEDPNHIQLVVDRYHPKIDLTVEKMSQILGVPLFATLPSNGMERFSAMNEGVDIFHYAGHCAYAQKVRQMANDLFYGEKAREPKRKWLNRLFGVIGQGS